MVEFRALKKRLEEGQVERKIQQPSHPQRF